MSKVVYYEDANFCFEYEQTPFFVVIHCTVSIWSKSVLRNAYSVFGRFVEECLRNGITRLVTFSPNPKFAKLFGGTSKQTMIHDGKEIEVLIWELQ